MSWQAYWDSREQEPIPSLVEVMENDLRKKALDSGDFALYLDGDPIIGIERKKIGDLVNSIKDKRIFKQADRMRKRYQVSILMIRGTLKSYEEMMWNRGKTVKTSVIMGTLTSLMVRNGMNLMWFESDDYLVDAIDRIFTKVKEGKVGQIRSTNVRQLRSRPCQTLMAVPGITYSVARSLIDEFGNIEAIKQASVEELCEIYGIGEKRADSLRRLLKDEEGN